MDLRDAIFYTILNSNIPLITNIRINNFKYNSKNFTTDSKSKDEKSIKNKISFANNKYLDKFNDFSFLT